MSNLGKSATNATIAVPPTLKRPHKLVTSTRKTLCRESPDNYGRLWSRREPCLDVTVSRKSLPRALRYMNSLLKECGRRKFNVEAGKSGQAYLSPRRNRPDYSTRLLVEDEWITLRLVEKCGTQRSPMPQPPKGLRGPELKSWRWLNSPRVRFVPNGVLELRLTGGFTDATFRDGKRYRLEDRLEKVFERLHSLASDIKEARAESERRRRKCEEERRLREEEDRRQQEEQQRARELREEVANWRLAREIRAYVAEVRMATTGSCGTQHAQYPIAISLTWALRYADRIDPLNRFRPGAMNAGPESCGHARVIPPK